MGLRKMVEFVYPYVMGQMDGLELRYSLRSIDKWYGEDAVVTVIGDRPRWLTGVNYLPGQEKRNIRWGSFYNVMEKMGEVAGSRQEEVGSRQYGGGSREKPEGGEIENDWYVWMNDDMFFLRRVDEDLLKLPKWRCDAAVDDFMKGTGAGLSWKELMDNTIRLLKEKTRPLKVYETHMPRVFYKNRASEILALLPLPADADYTKRMFMFSTMYYNMGDEPGVRISDVKNFKLAATISIDTQMLLLYCKEHMVMNINIWRCDMKQVLGRLYAGKSRFE